MFGNRIDGYRNSKRMAINGMVKRLCKEEDVGYVDLWAVADRGVSGPWATSFCGALCKGVTQHFPAGVWGVVSPPPPGGSGQSPGGNAFL